MENTGYLPEIQVTNPYQTPGKHLRSNFQNKRSMHEDYFDE